jgi:membrane associated rhomboid family serine protease
LVLGIWVATQVVMVAMPDLGPIAWWAHIGGLIAGAVLIVFMRRPGVALFDHGTSLA